jgi:hypothetical protein
MDPITGGLLVQLGSGLLTNLFSTPSAAAAPGPSQAQIAAILAQQATTRAAESTRNAWMIGIGLAAAGAVAMVVVLARK